MKTKIPFLPVILLALLASCGPAILPLTETPEVASPTLVPFFSPTLSSESLSMTAEMALTHTPTSTLYPFPEDSLSLTAAMATVFASTPSSTPPAWATIIPSAGDLGWGSVYGKIIDGVTMLPIEGATVTCAHSSYVSPYLCNGVTFTNRDGAYAFTGVFFHDTDRIMLIVEAPGYESLRFEQPFLTRPELHADLGLFPELDGDTPTPSPTATWRIVCTPPICNGGVLTCGSSDGCPGGCGTICQMPSPTP